jgi:hypothetical protein
MMQMIIIRRTGNRHFLDISQSGDLSHREPLLDETELGRRDVMIQGDSRQRRTLRATVSLFVVTLLCGVPIGFAADSAAPSSSAQEQKNQPAEPGDIQERGLTKDAPGKVQGDTKVKPKPAKPGGGLPAKLCHEVTHMRTECRCANSTDCQVLSTLCPGSCPAGSQSCQCTPLFRGTPPPLPQNLCGFQVPWTTIQCSCDNQADCQVLSTVCPGLCPPGNQSCQCTPLQRR